MKTRNLFIAAATALVAGSVFAQGAINTDLPPIPGVPAPTPNPHSNAKWFGEFINWEWPNEVRKTNSNTHYDYTDLMINNGSGKPIKGHNQGRFNAIDADHFSAKYTTFIRVNSWSDIKFKLNVDDGAIMYLNHVSADPNYFEQAFVDYERFHNQTAASVASGLGGVAGLSVVGDASEAGRLAVDSCLADAMNPDVAPCNPVGLASSLSGIAMSRIGESSGRGLQQPRTLFAGMWGRGDINSHKAEETARGMAPGVYQVTFYYFEDGGLSEIRLRTAALPNAEPSCQDQNWKTVTACVPLGWTNYFLSPDASKAYMVLAYEASSQISETAAFNKYQKWDQLGQMRYAFDLEFTKNTCSGAIKFKDKNRLVDVGSARKFDVRFYNQADQSDIYRTHVSIDLNNPNSIDDSCSQ